MTEIDKKQYIIDNAQFQLEVLKKRLEFYKSLCNLVTEKILAEETTGMRAEMINDTHHPLSVVSLSCTAIENEIAAVENLIEFLSSNAPYA